LPDGGVGAVELLVVSSDVLDESVLEESDAPVLDVSVEDEELPMPVELVEDDEAPWSASMLEELEPFDDW
jgi:hypothetical protein